MQSPLFEEQFELFVQVLVKVYETNTSKQIIFYKTVDHNIFHIAINIRNITFIFTLP